MNEYEFINYSYNNKVGDTTVSVEEAFIESKNIKVFPCAYRGYYDTTGETPQAIVFDPEARSTTEANFTNTFHKLSNTKDSYVVGWDNSQQVLKCVIGGYYFEISNYSIDKFFYTEDDKTLSYYLCIKTETESLASSADDSRETSILSSFAESQNYLDIKENNNIGARYIFTGLAVRKADNLSGVSASLKPFTADYTFTKVATVSEENKQIGNYYLNNNEYIKITIDNPAVTGVDAYSRTITYRIDPVKLPITSLLDTAEGKYSLRMIEDTTNESNNNTVAEGDYAIALGKHTKANGLASVAFGDNTEATGNHAVVFGNNNKAHGNYSLAIGGHTEAEANGSAVFGYKTKATSANQVVIGQYNSIDNNQAFIIANGTESSSSNKFTVGYEGNVKALGNLEVKGFIKATGSAANDLELGTSAANSNGSIKVYGNSASETPIFKVENTGNTTIAGIAHITNAAESGSKTSGALIVDGGVGIAKKLNVGGDTNIIGNTTLNNNLTVANDKATSLGGSLTVNKQTTLKDTLTVEGNKKTTLGGELEVSENTKLNGTLEVATGKATTLGGTVSITDDTEASESSAALTVAGGAKIAKKLTVGSDAIVAGDTSVSGDVIVAGNTSIGGTIEVTSTATIGSSLTATNGTASFGVTNISGDTSITSTTTATAKDTGALKVTGGAGIGENLYVGGTLNAEGTTTLEGALIVAGNETIEGTIVINNETDANAYNSGALTVDGGVGIAKQLRVNGNASLYANANINGDLTIAGNDTSNTLTIGSKTTSNQGGKLDIYGSGANKVFEVDTLGNIKSAGDIEIEGTAAVGGSLTIEDQIIISKDLGISGIPSLSVNGKIEGQYFNATSDIRKKCNIEEFNSSKSILDLPIKQFEYINDSSHKKYIGCIAQDLQEIYPELVDTDSEGYLSIQESKLVYLLIKEVKELKEKIKHLQEE